MSEYVFKTDSPIRSCSECDYRCGLNIIARKNQQGRHEHCPLVELPQHGDLVDEADLRDRAYNMQIRDRISFPEALSFTLLDAPIILEASE